jgi:hypothetical protein
LRYSVAFIGKETGGSLARRAAAAEPDQAKASRAARSGAFHVFMGVAAL